MPVRRVCGSSLLMRRAAAMSVNVAIAGATGAVGQEFLGVLAERDFPIKSIKFLASSRSAGKTIEFRGRTYTVEELTHDSFKGVQIAFFSAGGSTSKEFAPSAVKAGGGGGGKTQIGRAQVRTPV